jgi:hypothetical protein
MLGKALLVSGLLASFGANAAVTITQSGTDPNGASVDKTTIITLPTQTTAFDFVGSLDTVGSIQTNKNAGAEFGLYLGSTLVKDITFFTVDTTHNIYSFNFLNLAAGDYTFRFNINGNEASRAYSFTSSITAVTTPVPEPENLGLMVFGVCLMGLIARRKQTA